MRVVTILACVFGACAVLVLGGSKAQALRRCENSLYANFSTAPTFIKVQFPDAASGTVKSMILPNYSFGTFWLQRKGIKLGEYDYGTVIRSQYVPYMDEHEDGPLDIDIAEFVRWYEERRSGGKRMTDEQVREAVAQIHSVRSYTFAELGFASRDELLDAISRMDKGKVPTSGGTRPEVSIWDDRFISLLFDQDIVFGHGDVVPFPIICDRSER